MAERFTGFTSKVIPLPAENVDTDQVVPARYLKVTDKAGLAEALFHDWRYEEDGSLREPRFVLDRPDMAGRRILLAGDNFGAGSSREHAPWALTSWGIRAILSTSFADIFRNNALKNGLLPIVLEAERHRQLFELVASDADVEVVDFDNPGTLVEYGQTGRVKLTTLTKEFFMPGFLERDEGEREPACDKYPWDGISGVRPYRAFAATTTVGVY